MKDNGHKNNISLINLMESVKKKLLETIFILEDETREQSIDLILKEATDSIQILTNWDIEHTQEVIDETFSIKTIRSCSHLLNSFVNCADSSIRFVSDDSYDVSLLSPSKSNDVMDEMNNDLQKLQEILNSSGVIGKGTYETAQNIMDVSLLKEYLNEQILN